MSVPPCPCKLFSVTCPCNFVWHVRATYKMSNHLLMHPLTNCLLDFKCEIKHYISVWMACEGKNCHWPTYYVRADVTVRACQCMSHWCPCMSVQSVHVSAVSVHVSADVSADTCMSVRECVTSVHVRAVMRASFTTALKFRFEYHIAIYSFPSHR